MVETYQDTKITVLTLALKQTLESIRTADRATDYDRRYYLVYEALHLALKLGYEAGVRMDPQEPEWPVVYIELPDGQVSWHMPQHKKPWDGHTPEEKYVRIGFFCGGGR